MTTFEAADQPCQIYAPPRIQAFMGPPASEAALLGRTLHLCRLYGHLAYHTHDSRGSQPGFPDLVIVGTLGVLFRELKMNGGRMSTDQILFGRRLREAGEDFGMWTPEDYASGRITWELGQISQLAALRQLPLPPAELYLDEAA